MDTTTISPNLLLLLNSQQPDFLNSINELSELSTAVSAFLHDFHDLRNHITSITSAIDAQLPPHLLLLDATTSEAIFEEPNLNETEKSNGELTLANNDELMKEKESDIMESEQDINDIWNMIEDIDCRNNNAPSKRDPEKSDSFRKAGEIDKLKEDERTDISTEDPEPDVAQKKKKKRKREETDVPKEDEEIDTSKESDEITISKKKPRQETDASKKLVENDILNRLEEMDVPKEPQEETDASKKPVEVDVLNKPEEIGVLKKPLEETDASKKEIDVSKKPEEIDVLKKADEIDASKKPSIAELEFWCRRTIKQHAETMQELSDLKSIRRCLETHKVDPSKFLSGIKMNERIERLGKLINELDIKLDEQKSTLKRIEKETEFSKLNNPEEIDVSKKPDEIDVSNKLQEIDASNKAHEIDASKKPAIAVLEFLCKYRHGTKVRKHVMAHISELNSLHQEIAMALKLARHPAMLVLDCICRFFLPTSRTCYHGEFMHQERPAKLSKGKGKHIVARQASVLLLESFVMISGDGIEIRKKDKEYAENAAIDWRERMINEGGLIYMEEVDARGLLLFISGFGIPDGVFSNEDFSDLIRASNVKEISNALRHSTILISKLPEVIDWMVKNNLEIEAADIAYTFGLEDKCHPETILMTFLHPETDASKKPVEVDILNKPEEIGVLEKPLEETDASKKEIDVLNQPKEVYVSNKPQEIDVSKKPEEIDVLKKADEIDASKKPSIAELEFWCRRAIKQHAETMQELSDLKSIRRCLETHKVDDPSKFLSGIKMNERIERLEKLINELDIKLDKQKSTLKRIEKETEFSKLNNPEEIDVSKKPDEIDVSNKLQEIDASNKAHEIDASKKPAIAVLEFLCKYRHSTKVRKHVVAHISELNSLHQEIAMALKLARHPAMLVLDCICRFFLPTSRASYHGEFMHQERAAKLSKGKGKHIVARQASVLLLESFVMISGDGIEIRKKDKEYAENAAIDWRERMINEGGLICMEEVDARGLLLFISGFGIPDGVFSNEDFSDLIRASNVKEISNALRHSTILISKLPEVIDWMVKNNLEIEAADIAYTFGLEDKCHPETILMTFLHNEIKDTQNGSSLQVNAAMMQQLSDLKFIRSCLETHKIDPSKFLPGVKINEKIEELEKVLSELDSKSTEEKSTLKREKKETESSKSNKPEKFHVSKKPDEMDVSNKPKKDNVLHKPEEIDVSKKADEIDPSKKPAIAELEFWCKTMNAKKIKKHVVAHISEMNSLHQEIAKALKLARNPARLVLHSIGRYFLQSSGAYFSSNGHQQIVIRQASVLILECFVIISGNGIKITKEDEEYTNNAAIDWRKRMLKEGGLICMEAVDARGLLLFISGFGIPEGVFSNEDFSDLIRASNVKEISNALRHSTILIPKLPEVIDWMVKNKLEIEAADIAYTFGLEDKCHPETILMTFLHNKIKDAQNGSSIQVNAAMMQQLSYLKSIRRCLETHKIDPSKSLPGVNINEKIEQLEKVINELDLKSNEVKSLLKRKRKKTKFSKLNKPQEIDVSKKPVEFDASNKPAEIDVSNKPAEIDVSKKANKIDASKKPAIAKLELLCKTRNARKLKSHVMAHISELNLLHQEIAMALKLAKKPAMLVLDCICRFFLPTSRAYYHGEFSHQQLAAKFSKEKEKHIVARQASVLLLESFVLISGDGMEISKEDKEYAENAAIDWRERMINEGGLIHMEAVDARGLLLFISGFGIPSGVFSIEDFSDLIRASKVKEISNALRHSTILISKLPEVIDWMVKNNLEIEAADIAYTFGLEDKCHPETILMTFLHNRNKDTQNGSSLQANAATTHQLSDLKSIRRCLETHKIDPSKFIPGVNINEKIEQLEKVINELDLKSNGEKSTLKRKEKETQFSKDLNHQQQAKRICSSQGNLNPHDHYGIHPYNLSTHPSRGSYFDRNLPNNNHVTNYSASSVFGAPVPPQNIISSGLAGSYGPFVYGGPVTELMPNMNNPWPYRGQAYPGQSQAYHPYPSFPGLPDHSLPGGFFGWRAPSSDLYRFADTAVKRGSPRGPHPAGSSTRR